MQLYRTCDGRRCGRMWRHRTSDDHGYGRIYCYRKSDVGRFVPCRLYRSSDGLTCVPMRCVWASSVYGCVPIRCPRGSDGPMHGRSRRGGKSVGRVGRSRRRRPGCAGLICSRVSCRWISAVERSTRIRTPCFSAVFTSSPLSPRWSRPRARWLRRRSSRSRPSTSAGGVAGMLMMPMPLTTSEIEAMTPRSGVITSVVDSAAAASSVWAEAERPPSDLAPGRYTSSSSAVVFDTTAGGNLP